MELQETRHPETAQIEITSTANTQPPAARRKKGIGVANIIGIILCVLLLPGFLVSTTLVVSSFIHPDTPPSCLGYTPLVVESGSMSPFFEQNDLVLVQSGGQNEAGEYDVGTVICFRSGDVYVTHRIVEASKDENGETVYTTQGDANNTPDSQTVGMDQIIGVYRTHFTGLGRVLLFIQTPIGMVTCVILPILLIILLFTVPSKVAAWREKKRMAKEGSVE